MADQFYVLDSYTCTIEDEEAGTFAYVILEGDIQIPFDTADLMVRYNGAIYELAAPWAEWDYTSTHGIAEIHYNSNTNMRFIEGDVIELVQVPQSVTLYNIECRVCTNYILSDTSGGIAQGGGLYQAGTQVTVTATPNHGYMFMEWTLGGRTTDLNPYTFTVQRDEIFYACFDFASFPYNLYFYPNTEDLVTNMPETLRIFSGENEIPSNVPRRRDYKFIGWAIDTDLDTAEEKANEKLVSIHPGDTHTFEELDQDWYAVAVWEEAEYYNVIIHTEGGFSNDVGSRDDIELQFEVIDVESQPTFEGLDFVPIKYSYRLLGIYDENNNAVFTESGHPITGIYFDGWSRWRYTGSNRNITFHAVWESEQFIYDDQKHRLIYSGGHSSYGWDDNL